MVIKYILSLIKTFLMGAMKNYIHFLPSIKYSNFLYMT